jgi:hypothetical protein
VVISQQPGDKDTASIPDSCGDSGVDSIRRGKFNKTGSRGSLSEEDSGVGSERHNQSGSEIADQTDSLSQSDDCASSKPDTLSRTESIKDSENEFDDFEKIMTVCGSKNDLTAEIAEELFQINGK